MIKIMKPPSLSDKDRKAAEVIASNEINDVMADLEILEEELDRTFLFKGLTLRDYALRHLRKYPRNNDGTSLSDETLEEIFKYYFGENAKGNL